MRKLLLLCGVTASALVFAGPPATGHLVGHVDVGPIRPVQRPGEKEVVPPEMYKQYKVTISRTTPPNTRSKPVQDKPLLTLTLSGKGDFSADLQPGTYTVRVIPTDRTFYAMPQEIVKILPKRTVKVTLKVDTGIR